MDNHTIFAFAVGAMSRDQLEDLTADLDLAYDKHVSGGELRASIIEALDAQGKPCIKVEYDPEYEGGDYSGDPTVVYIPIELIDAAGSFTSSIDEAVAMAFRKFTHRDSMHLVAYESDHVVTSQGEDFVGADILHAGIHCKSTQTQRERPAFV